MRILDAVRAFTEKTDDNHPVLPAMGPGYGGGVGTEQDLEDYAYPEMIEASRKEDSHDPNYGLTESEPVRILNGALDFLGQVGEELEDVIHHTENGEGHAWKEAEAQTGIIRVWSVAPKQFRTTRYTVDRTEQVVRTNEGRRTVRLVNLGPEVVYFSHTPGPVGTRPNANSIPISKLDGTGPYMPIDIATSDEIWLTPSTLAVASIVEVLETMTIPQ